jgi:hypothetical protein
MKPKMMDFLLVVIVVKPVLRGSLAAGSERLVVVSVFVRYHAVMDIL